MLLRVFPALLLFAGELIAAAETIELTGLVNIPGCSLACVQFDATGVKVSLHPGESAFGYTLQQIDAAAGRALFRRDTNEIWIALVSPPDFSHKMQAAAAAQQETTSVSFSRMGASQPVAESPQNSANRHSFASPVRSDTFPFNNGNASPPVMPGLAGLSGSASNPASSANKISDPRGVQSPSTLSAIPNPSLDSGDSQSSAPNVVLNDAQLTASPTLDPAVGNDAPPPTQAQSQPLSEGDRIRLFYGTQAYMAWDFSRHHR